MSVPIVDGKLVLSMGRDESISIMSSGTPLAETPK